ncbi:hypothetical protein TIFTF001_048924, partial [Ficus carica]
MKRLLVVFITSLIYFLFFLHDHIAVGFIPADNITLNCGSQEKYSTAQDDRPWMGDESSKFALIQGRNTKSYASRAVSQNSVEEVPYMTARISHSEFTYSFSVTPGPKFVRLYFYPTLYQDGSDTSKAFFTVTVGNSFTLLRNFSAYFVAKHMDTNVDSFMREFSLVVEENQRLNITFIPFSPNSYAFINGIEIVSMPTALYFEPAGDMDRPSVVGETYQLNDFTHSALETMYRLNVGGSTISPMQDTGMYRQWSPDDPYWTSIVGVVPCNTSKQLNYTKIPNYTAPENVYRTAKSMGNDSTANRLYNLSWGLPVDSGFNYLVRLHFCEFEGVMTEINDRRFRIYLDNQTAERTFDVIELSGGDGIPVYRDYVVNHINQDYLSIELHPREAVTRYINSILNGVEVFKMSNNGNLAGPNPPAPPEPGPSLVPTTEKSNSKKALLTIALGSGVAGFLVLLSMVCCVVLLRLRKEKRHHSSYKRKSSKSTRGSSRRLPEQLCHRFSFSEIKSATNNFNQALVIGRGGFGNVYRGHIDDEFPEIAIKRLSKGRSSQGEREFEAEIKLLSQLRHVHLVSLVGYCDDGHEMILVYDYMANGTLRDHL